MRISLLKLRIALLIAVITTSLSLGRIALGRPATQVKHRALTFTPPPPVVFETHLFGDARDVLQRVNLERRDGGLNPLQWDEKLSDLALDYSKRMATEEFFSHFDPEGRSLLDRAAEHKIKDWLKLGENLFLSKGNDNPARAAVWGWNRSESHRSNMLDPDWTHTGVGVYTEKGGRTYITQVFMQK